MHRILVRIFLFSVLLSAGCVTVASEQGTFEVGLGSTTSSEAVRQIRDVLQVRYGYGLDREVVSRDRILFRTEWKSHTPSKKEQVAGIRSYRTRIEIRAHPGRREGGEVSEYNVTFEGECEVKREGQSWTKELPPSRKEYFEKMASFLENEFKGGMRTL